MLAKFNKLIKGKFPLFMPMLPFSEPITTIRFLPLVEMTTTIALCRVVLSHPTFDLANQNGRAYFNSLYFNL
ncbi:hypothetical protein PN36_25825 [Candidatus Thiomargarita nelsonii]|uniref:Uncharacterized protein n=1 Tax=Candidatus Thiomargarita nelsonii TaxID=1003181 RepID=A0A4E0QQP6_9GAMM|nr:hypothetical protein PN36_25825 [Candidatus Thiomargarita nelsonii]